MKTTTKSFFLGVFLTIVAIFAIAATSRQLIGPNSATTDNAIVVWDGTSAFKTKNSGVIYGSPSSITYGRGIPRTVSLGTIGSAGTATLANTNSQYYATFSGATAIIALPSTPDDGTFIIHGTTTYNSGEQIITVPSLVRPEFNPSSAITTFTNAASTSGLFTAAFTAINGNFVKFSVVGDAYQ